MFYISYKKVLLVTNNILPTLDISQVLIKSRNVMTMPFAIIWNLSSITKQVYNEGNINSFGSHCLSIISEAPCIFINGCTDVHIWYILYPLFMTFWSTHTQLLSINILPFAWFKVIRWIPSPRAISIEEAYSWKLFT